MKKRIAIALATTMILTLAACGSSEDDSRQTAEPVAMEDISEAATEDISDSAAEEAAMEEELSETITEIDGVANTVDDTEDSTEGEQGIAEEPAEGASVVEEGRFWDQEEIMRLDMAGSYNGIVYGTASVSIYTSTEEDSPFVGNVEVTDKDGNVVYSGELQQVMTNYYEIYGTPVNFTVFTDNEVINLDMYIDGQHEDYFTMVEPYIS